MAKSVIAIAGRANVGKSTLLNRLAGKRLAVVADLPGTTRDRVLASVTWQGREMTLIDTGGYLSDFSFQPAEIPLQQKVAHQIERAVSQADAIIFLVDGKEGVIAADEEIAEILRRAGKPITLAVNKMDARGKENQIADFYRLGLGQPIPVSAYHNLGMDRLMETVVALLPEQFGEPSPGLQDMKLAIVGKPNAGKSTLLNALLGEERAIVDEVPGTTRDSLDAVVRWVDKEVLLIDTAGIKRRGRVGRGVEYYSLLRSLQAIDRCDVALLLIDATEFVTAQDMHIANYIVEVGKSIVVVVNKWDLVPATQKKEIQAFILWRFKFLSYVPFLYVSAKKGTGISRILPGAWAIWQQSRKRLSQRVIERVIKQAVDESHPVAKGMRRLRIVKAYQDETSLATFILSVNDPQLVYPSYQRYLEKRLRRKFGFRGSPLRLIFNKYKSKNRGN
ncbi:MAG: ribosome biogenesis GTPase Der [Dehalococcoidia bacterium]|nr:ribosome biogenesis GTPase Der [Dehalococcoidia bacterium]